MHEKQTVHLRASVVHLVHMAMPLHLRKKDVLIAVQI